jgi:Galactose mutarotase and related enzymes
MELICEKLKNKNGMEVTLSNLGAAIISITVPDKNGERVELTLGYENPEDYIDDLQFMGSTPGRYANRIKDAMFTLNGTTYQLTVNDRGSQLHGGRPSFAHRLWESERNENQVKNTYTSPDGENGYPGNLNVETCYTLNDNNEIVIEYSAISDADTVINLTNHAYFNLVGSGTILDHVLKLDADAYVVTDDNYSPTGEIRSVSGTHMDFTSAKRLGDAIFSDDEMIKKYGGLDSSFTINGTGLRSAAILNDPESGRTLEVITDLPGVQVYTSQMLPEGTIGRGGIAYVPHSAVCLEAQNYPDAPNQPNFPSPVLRAGETFKATIIYRFSF